MTIVRSMTLKFHNARRQVSTQLKNHQVAAESFFYFSFSLFTYAFVDYWHKYRQRKRLLEAPQKVPQVTIQADAYYLQKAHQLRQRLKAPPQSEFRVVCCLLLEDGTEIWGTNDEVSPCLGSSICAERAACLSYRVQQCTTFIHKIYVVTDAPQPLPPGTLCREYLYCHPATNSSTKVCLQGTAADPGGVSSSSGAAATTTWTLTLEDLYPYPSAYCRPQLTSLQASRLGRRLEESMDVLLSHLVIPGLFGDQTLALLNAAHQAALQDDSHDQQLHPLQYGAAMAVLFEQEDRLEYWQAHQLKAYEYGGSQDPVCQLVARAVQYSSRGGDSRQSDNAAPSPSSPTASSTAASAAPSGLRVLALCQVDQYGIPHAPFGAARACLVEHGLGDAQVVVTFETMAAPSSSTTSATDPLSALAASSDLASGPGGGGRRSPSRWFVDDEDSEGDDPRLEVPSLSVCAVQAKELAPYVPVIRHGSASATNGGGGGGGGGGG